MSDQRFARHLNQPEGLNHTPPDAFTGAAGGAACGDIVRISLAVSGDRVVDFGFAVKGCGAMTAAASAAATLSKNADVFAVASIGPEQIAEELGGLIAPKMHAAELVADALQRALGAAVRERAEIVLEPGRALIAMSGGVDSAVAALLTKQSFSDIVAVTLELWADAENDAEGSCCSASAVRYARALAQAQGIPHFTLDLREEFRAGVVSPFIDAHRGGLTPNPCVLCNGFVRLDAMIEFADRIGASKLATGHYAQICEDADELLLKQAVDANKDQTYMLTALSSQSLRRMHFPLGSLTKPEVRELAEEAQLSVAKKPESQDLCFLAGTDRERFLSKHGELEENSGEIIKRDGTVVGIHNGHQYYTVGQRRGLGVADTEPLYVLATDAKKNQVVIGKKDELKTTVVKIRDVELRRSGSRVNRVKLRYRTRPLACSVRETVEIGTHAELVLNLKEPVYGAAPGQTASLMDGELLIGWGTIV